MKERFSPIIPVVFYHGERKWNVSKYLLGREYKNKHIFNFSYQLINIQDISEEEYESNLKWIIFAFKNIWRIQRDDKDLYSLIKYFLSILKYEKDDKFALQTIKALLLYLINAFPTTKRVEATKIITEYSKKEGGNMAETLLELLKENLEKDRMQKIVLNMKKEDISIDIIKKVTGLSIKEIEKL